MVSAQLVDELIQLTEGISRGFRFDPKVPTAMGENQLLDVVRRAAPLLLTVFGSPAAAVQGLSETFHELFSRLDRIEEKLGRIEESINRIEERIKRLEQKIDAATLAKFRAGFHELRDGLRARERSYSQQLLLSARTKLTEIAELPLGLVYFEVILSQRIAAASCLLIGIIDTWAGEIGGAQRYNLRAIAADPLWSEDFLPKSLIRSVAGASLDNLERDTNQKLEAEATRFGNSLWEKVLSRVQVVIRSDIPKAVAQQGRLSWSIYMVKENSLRQRAEILSREARERLSALGEFTPPAPPVAEESAWSRIRLRQHLGRGNGLENQGEIDQAIAEYRKAIDLAPRFALAHYDLGSVLARQGETNQAIAETRKAIDLDPSLALAHSNLGVFLDRQGKTDEAIAELGKAIELRPSWADVQNNLRSVLHRQGKTDTAIAAEIEKLRRLRSGK